MKKIVLTLMIGFVLIMCVPLMAQDTSEVAKPTDIEGTIVNLEEEYNEIVDGYIKNLRLRQSMTKTYQIVKDLDAFADLDNARIAKLAVEYDSVSVLIREDKIKLDNLKHTLEFLREPPAEDEK